MTGTMVRYKYQAEDLEGQSVKGEIHAVGQRSRNQLAVQGIRVTKIAERKGLQVEITPQKIPLVEIMHFSRQMATFTRSGVPVIEAIDNLRQDTKNKRFAAVLTDMLESVTNGRSVTEAIQRHGDVFPSYFLAMLASAELTGRLDEAFDQLYRYLKRDVELARQVRKALIYPMILMVVAIGVSGLIVVFVIPKFADFFKDFGAELPLPTRMLIAVADFVQSWAGAAFGVSIVVLILSFLFWIKQPSGKKAFHGFLLKAPLIGTVVTYSSTERFTRVLSALLDAGVALPEALPSAIDCSNNVIYKQRLTEATEGVLAGDGFAEPMRATGLFPTTVIQMVRVGERTGELSDQLGNAAGFYEEELNYSVDKLTQWFEPLVLIFIGVVVGFVALAMVSAMYGIYGQVNT